jgi:hypothetical protein
MSNNIVKRILHANLSVEAIRIKNSTTTFGIVYPKGTMIFDESTTLLYILTNIAKPYDTLISLVNDITLLTPNGGKGDIHNGLIGRDADDSHPISAITDLQTTLDLNAAFDGTRRVTRVGLPADIPGGSTLKDVFENWLYPFINIVVGINSSSLVKEIGTSNPITVYGSIVPNSETGSSGGIIKLNGVSVHTFGIDDSYTKAVNFNPRQGSANPEEVLSQTYIAYATGNESAAVVNSLSKVLTGVYPYLHGYSSSNLETGGTALYDAMTKLAQTKGDKVISFTGTGYMYFAYPASYGLLNEVKDPNGFPTTQFELYAAVNVSSNGLAGDWTNISYNIYKAKTISTQTGGEFTFNL